jgi:SAM-dependent methyltransferase
MAQKTAALQIPTVIGDAFSTPFAPGTFAAVVSTRFAFHWADIAPLIAEMARVVRPGGTVVLDTYTWSARSALPLGASQWGGLVYPHSNDEVATLAAESGLRVRRMEPCFLFSPYLYRLAPVPLQVAFERLERHAPTEALCRVFWKLTLNGK